MNHDSFHHLEITESHVQIVAILKYSHTLHNEKFIPYAYDYYTLKKNKLQLLEV